VARSRILVSALPLALLAASGCASVPSSGASAAGALALTGPDGERATLDQLRAGRDATVLVFWSGTCPCVRRYQERVDALLDTRSAARVRVLGVSSNAGETHEEALHVARERQVRIPIYRDEGGVVARALGAESTPTVAVLDRSGALRYLGWLDNERLPGDPAREAWLDAALTGVLEGAPRFAARSPTYGCQITRSLFGAAQSPCCTVHWQ
jgi:hypothetical protein